MTQLTIDFEAQVAVEADDAIAALEDLFSQANRYRTSGEYMRLFLFLGWFTDYSPFNAVLLYTQNPKVTRVATPLKWEKKFKRRIKEGSRPLVILKPQGPVEFVWDLADTEPIDPAVDPLKGWTEPFAVDGVLEPTILTTTLQRCASEGIDVQASGDLGSHHAGSILALPRGQWVGEKQEMRYVLTLNADHTEEEQFGTLAHELGHLFCGHLPTEDEGRWWKWRHLDLAQEELEAESVAFVVCLRAGLKTLSHRYLAGYAGRDDIVLPHIDLQAVLSAITYVESMGGPGFRSKRKNPDKK